MDQLRLYLLGTPRITIGDRELTMPRQKGLAILCYLAVSGEAQRRDTLASLLWPESNQSKARGSLRRELSLLKRTLGGDLLRLKAEHVSLAWEKSWSDFGEFQKVHGTIGSPQMYHDALVKAAALYRNDFLHGFTLRNCLEFDEWQLFQTERCRQQITHILESVIEGCSKRGDASMAITQAQTLLALNPLHEPTHQALIRLYATEGQFTSAIRQYETCVQIFETELGVAPSDETILLYQQLQHGRSSTSVVESKVPSAPFPAARQPHNNLPLFLMPLLGRERELIEVQTLLNALDIRLLTVHGSGGIGKTHFAASVATNQLAHYADGVAFVALAAVEQSEAIWSALANALDLALHTETLPQRQLSDYLQQKAMLLILDNYEHLVESTDVIITLLQAAPGLKIIVTSRVSLQVHGEQLYRLNGLQVLEESEINDISDNEIASAKSNSAVDLFMRSVWRTQPQYQPTPHDMTQIGRICRLVDGMPLGILLAASWMDLLTPGEIAAQLTDDTVDTSLDFLQTEQRALPHRQRSLRTVFDHSWRLLTEAERVAFRRFSVFRGGCALSAAQQVTGATPQILMALLHKSLLQRNDAGRFEIHELVRQYAAEQLAKLPKDVETTQARHSAYFGHYLATVGADLPTAQQEQALALIEADLENGIAAWHWCCDKRNGAQLAMFMEALGWFYRWRSRYQEGEKLFEHAVTTFNHAPSAEQLLTRIRLMIWLGSFGRPLHPVEPIGRIFDECVVLLETAKPTDPTETSEHDRAWLATKAFLLLEMGEHKSLVDIPQAQQMIEDAVTLYKRLCDRWHSALALTTSGSMHFMLGYHEKARNHLEEGLALQQAQGDQRGTARILHGLSRLANSQREFKRAESLAKKGLANLQKTRDLRTIGDLKHLLAINHNYSGRFLEAAQESAEARDIYHKLGDWSNYGRNCDDVGFAVMHLGRYQEVSAHSQRAYEQCIRINDQHGIGFSLQTLGFSALAQASYDEAQQRLRCSIDVLRAQGGHLPITWSLINLGLAEYFLEDAHVGKEHIAEGCREILKYNHQLVLIWALPAIALLEAEQGNLVRAAEIYALALEDPHIANSRWHTAVTGARITELITALPPDQLDAARQRGRMLDALHVVSSFVNDATVPS